MEGKVSYDRLTSPRGDPIDIEAISHFWDAALAQLAAYVEVEERPHPEVATVPDSPPLFDAGAKPIEHDDA
jgi:hypothetical protein